MAEEKINTEEVTNEANAPEVANSDAINAEVSVAVKRKRFKKLDLLMLGVCLVVSLLIWLYASNLQKTAEQKEMTKDKEVIAGAIDDINKTTETSAAQNN